MFQFKQFTIHQDRTPMKVGTDGVLLGAWAELENASTILDIGTGTGLLALMAAQRNSRAQIDAIDIVASACQQAQENIHLSPWSTRIRVYQQALQSFHPSYSYDCILCNPPFFEHSTPAPEPARSLARHSDPLPHHELIDHVVRLLLPAGSLQVILPVQEANRLILYAESKGLFPHRITHVHPTPEKAAKRLLIHFTFCRQSPEENKLIIELARHHYSQEYIALTRTFYLKME